MTSGIPYDSEEGRAICGALTAIMTGVSYATSAEMAGELGPFPGYKENAKHMLRVMRNHRRAAHGENDRLRGLSVNPVPLDHANCPGPDLIEARHRCLGQGAVARREERLPQRAGHRDCADRHHRPGDGLRHHRHRAGLSRW
jgi:ribonucleotide reductase alpha subunit